MFLNPWYSNSHQSIGGPDGVVTSTGHEGYFNDVAPSGGTQKARSDTTRPPLGCSVHSLPDGRVFYFNHVTEKSSWLPPAEIWNVNDLPYGWEEAVDSVGRPYYIDHINKITTYDFPHKDASEEDLMPEPREVQLTRDQDMGFGFVAGSEKPVIVRFVTDGGPSVNKLLPGDQIWSINGEDVRKAPREQVIQLVRNSKESVVLTVCQPPLDNSTRKSALLSATKRQKLRTHPSRVRFAESVDINDESPHEGCEMVSSESTTPYMPNVLKVFLENGQTKSFKYDQSTSISDVLDSMKQKLAIKSDNHFALMVEHVTGLRKNKLTLLNPEEQISNIAARPGSQNLRCLYRLAFCPRDPLELLRKDSVAFEYLYLQCCNDVVKERFYPELRYNVVLQLAALHIHQHSSTSGPSTGKVSLKAIERECGLETFVPSTLLESMKRKELRKVLSYFLKLHGSIFAPEQKQMSPLQTKLHYLKIISELPSFGAKCFTTHFARENVDTNLLINPPFGISQIKDAKSDDSPDTLSEIENLTSVSISQEDDVTFVVQLNLKHPDRESLIVSLDKRDAEELVLVLQGYYRLLTEKNLQVLRDSSAYQELEEEFNRPPPYHGQHSVRVADWNYTIPSEDSEDTPLPVIDLSYKPPSYERFPGIEQVTSGPDSRHLLPSILSPQHDQLVPVLDANMNKTLSVYDNASEEDFCGKNHNHLDVSSRHFDRESRNIPWMGGFNDTMKNEKMTINFTTKRNDDLLGNSENFENSLYETESHRGSAFSAKTTKYSRPSSFGLHSPDNIPSNFKNHEPNFMTNEVEEVTNFPDAMERTSLYLDPDIIDLTMIPPPAALHENGARFVSSQVNTPPTPFADRETLDEELKALERDFGDLGTFTGLEWKQANGASLPLHLLSDSANSGTDDTDETTSMSSVSTTNTDTVQRVSSHLANFIKNSRNDNVTDLEEASRMALSQLGIHLEEGQDIDSFIADLTIPPPPEGISMIRENKSFHGRPPSCDLSNFIIPPPPPPPKTTSNRSSSSELVRRLCEAKEYTSRLADESKLEIDGFEKENTVDEMRVSSNQIEKGLGHQTGRVASLQRRFENSHQFDQISNGPNAYNDNFQSPSKSDRVKSKIVCTDSIKLSKFQRKQIYFASSSLTNKNNSSITQNNTISTHQNEEHRLLTGFEACRQLTKNFSVKEKIGQNYNLTHQNGFSNGNDLSSTQDELDSLGVCSSNGMSSSDEDENTNSHSNSKQYNCTEHNADSSDESLTSSLSENTVKSNSVVQRLNSQDVPPDLPPRNVSRSVPKIPPLPPTNSQQDTSKSASLKKTQASPLMSEFGQVSSEPSDCPPVLPLRQRKSQKSTNNQSSLKVNKFGSTQCEAPFFQHHKSLNSNIGADSNLPYSSPPTPPPKSRSVRENLISSSVRKTHSGELDTDGLSVTDTRNRNHEKGTQVGSSPKIPHKSFPNGNTSLSQQKDSVNHNGDFESFPLEGNENIEIMLPASRTSYKNAVFIFNSLLKKLSIINDNNCSKFPGVRSNNTEHDPWLMGSKESLTNESRQFVTASKLFVKSATESEDVLLDCLTNCLDILERMVNLAENLAECDHTFTRKVIEKVQEVIRTFALTTQSALCASGREMDHPSMSTLMTHATSLAAKLTELMKALKILPQSSMD